MFKVFTLAIGIAVFSGISGLHASTITKDMWVYEISVSESRRAPSTIFATTTAPSNTPVPAGCSAGSPSNDVIRILCVEVDRSTLGIDQTVFPSFTATIAFNESQFLCFGTLLPCSDENTVTYDLAIDYENGKVEYYQTDNPFYGFGDNSSNETYSLSPSGSSMTALFSQFESGSWDYGFDGRWGSYLEGDLIYLAGSGTLIQAPTIVPLPASAWFLSVGVLGLVALRRRRLCA
jgi:hypothetical protein